MFSEIIHALEKQLENPLPGRSAQIKMQPYVPGMPKIALPKLLTPKESAVMALLYPKDDIPYLVLIERVKYAGVHSGQISLPGGKLEIRESYQDAAVRETFEEVGISSRQYDIIGKLTPNYVPPSNFNIQPFIAVSNHSIDLHKDEREVANILETPLSFLFDADKRGEKVMKSAMGVQVMAPYFDIYGKTLWGATAMILSELIEIIQNSPQQILKYSDKK